ncbi:PAS domain-containing protein [Limimaricola sp. AA108-03]|uniref:PAS domain-containing protein n=1 Tax=Limimaricola sp. AA108-03 TaxID=3425945 RepID=UPI003D77623F
MEHDRDANLANEILQTLPLPVLALDADLRVEAANDAFLGQFRVAREETLGRLVYDLGNGQWNIPELRRLLGEILPQQTFISGYRVDHDFERIGRRIMSVSARRIIRSGNPDLILLALSDETEREGLRAELAGRLEFADKLIDSVREGLLVLDPDLRVRSASEAFYEAFKVDPSQTVGRLVYDLGNGQWDIPELRRLLEDILPRQNSFDDYEVTHTFEDIGERVMVLNGRRLDHMQLVLLAIRDITDVRESTSRLKEVSAAAHIGVFDEDRRAGTLFWSPELRDILGYPHDRPPPQAGIVPDFVHPEDRAAVAEMLSETLDPRGDGAIFHEHRVIRPDGAVRWVQMHGRTEFATFGGERRPARIRGVLLDVTERRAAEERLREAETRQTFLLELSDALRTRSEPSDITAVATRLLGKKLGATRAYFAEWPRGEDYGLVAPDYAVPGAPSLEGRYPTAQFRSAYEQLCAGGTWVVQDAAVAREVEEAERQYYCDVGVRAWVDVPLVRNGELRAALCVVQDSPRQWSDRDIALARETAERCWAAVERGRAEAALRASEKRYRDLFEAIDEGFCVNEFRFDGPDGRVDYRVVEANPAFYKHTGFSKAILGQWLREAAPDLEEHWFEIYGRVVETREPIRFEQKSDLLGRWFDVYAFPVGAPQDRRMAVLFKDVSQRKQDEDHQKMLMAELDHRVKNVLAVVQSIARQSLGRGQSFGPEAADRLVGRINALAQSHALLARSQWEGARFDDLVESAVAPYRGDRAERIAASGPDLKVTPKAAQTLNLAFHELVTNAAKYGALSRDAGQVTVKWHLANSREAPRLVITWQEQGGPPIEARPSRKGFGSLLIERALAAELEGAVSVDYARDGLRATFDLPVDKLRVRGGGRAPGSREKRAGPAGDPAALRGRKVLVVEDEHLVAQEVADILRSAGCAIAGPVGTLPGALQLAASEDLDAAVLDINLDGDLVWPVARALQARRIPFIFASGYGSTISPPPELASAERIEKPVTPESLLSALAASFEGTAASKSKRPDGP